MKKPTKKHLMLVIVAVLTCVAIGAYAQTQISLDAPASLPSDI